MTTPSSPFSSDALPINRSGRLTEEQRRHWQIVVDGRRTGIRRGAWVPAALALILLVGNGPADRAQTREAIGLGCLGVAALMFVLAGRGRLPADVADARVESIEGAIAKRVTYTGTSARNERYYFDINHRRLRTSRTAYLAAPSAGIVRAYFFPRTGRVVNLEVLPDRPLPTGADAAQQIVGGMIGALRSHDSVAMAEAQATAAAIAHAITGPPIDAGRDQAHAGLTADRLHGSWTNPLMTVTFAPDGTATLTVFGHARTGRWSMDASGRLLVGIEGEMAHADAVLTGDRLTIALEGRQMTFSRAS